MSSRTVGKAAAAAKRRATPTTDVKLAELRRRLAEVADLNGAGAVLVWDQATYMPAGGSALRARQGATLSRLAHEKFTDPEVGRLLDGLAAYAEGLPKDSDNAALIRVTRRDYDKATKVPAALVAQMTEVGSASYDAWTRARPANDFATMRPYLEQMLDFSRRYANYLGPYQHIADPLIDGPDQGMTAASVRALFGELRAALVPMVKAIAEQPVTDDVCLRRAFPEDKQLALGLQAIGRFGYDFVRGRLDKTHHPFCTKFGPGDVRITTRVKKTTSAKRCSLRCTRPGMRSMNRVSTRAMAARRSTRARRRACTRASRGCGRTWSAAAADSGRISIRLRARRSPISSARCRSRRSIGPSTRWSAR
jgi:Zn-dependent M32 family carboxypeptidase